MEPTNFHDTLIGWSQADDPNDLAKMVLGSPNDVDVVKDSGVAKSVSDKITEFLYENKNKFECYDQESLENLSGLVLRFTVQTKESLGEKIVDNLNKLVLDSIKSCPKDDDFTETVPLEVASIAYQFSSLLDLVNLSLVNKSASEKPVIEKLLKEKINNASMKEVLDFLTEVHSRFNCDPFIFKMMVQKFFQYSSVEVQ